MTGVQADPLGAVFLERWARPPDSGPVSLAIAGQLLDDALAAARLAWPSLQVAAPDYARYVAERMPPEATTPQQGLQQLHLTDLYLACAVVSGCPSAIEAFERHVFVAADTVLARLRVSPALGDEIKQALRQQWLMARADREQPLQLAEYRGRGELRKWFRVVAHRVALRALRKDRKQAASTSDEDLGDLVAPGDDPELAYLKRLYRTEFRQAFAEAFRELDTQQRNTMRYRHFEGLSIDEIGVLHGVHRATVARWLSRARQQLLTSVRRRMMGQLDVGSQELDSIMRLIESRLEVSIQRHFDGEEP